CGTNGCASQRSVLRARRPARLRESVGAVIGRVVVTVVIGLPCRHVPPGGLIERSATAHDANGPFDHAVPRPAIPDVPESPDLSFQNGRKFLAEADVRES